MRAFTNFALRLAIIVVSALMVPKAVLHAQEPDTAAVAKIPFAFQMGGHRYSAGTYTVALQREHVLSIHGKTDSGFTQVNWDSAGRRSATSELVFHRYGNSYFLRQIRIAGNADFLALPQSKEENRAQKELAIVESSTKDRDQESSVQIAMAGSSR